MTKFANALDREGRKVYLVADTSEQIDNHCKDHELTITSKPNYVDPVTVCNYFEWVGEGSRPAKWQIAKPPKRKSLVKN